jgi:hypothetical protein
MTWHFGFNRLNDLNKALVRGREDIFSGWHFANKASTATALPDYAVTYAQGDGVAATMRLVADDVTPVVLEHCGPYVADEAPEGMLECLEPFLERYTADR